MSSNTSTIPSPSAFKEASSHKIESTLEGDDACGLADDEDKNLSVFQAIVRRPRTTAWVLLVIWTCLVVSFEGQAGGMVLSIPRFRQDFGKPFKGDFVLDADWQSAFYGGPIAASVLGTFSAGYIADRIGRKPVMLVAIGLSMAAIGIQIAATTNAMFFGGKFLNGFVAGTLLSVCVTYIGEVTPQALRGVATCLTALMMALGPLIAAVIVDRTGTFENRWAYRAIFCSQFGFAGVTAIAGPFMPESPVYYMSVGKDLQADKSLRRLGFMSEAERCARLAQIRTNIEQSKAEVAGATYVDCFRQSNLRRTIISIMPLAIQALSGVFFIASYGTYYIQLAGFSTRASFKLQIGQHALSMAGNICSWFLIDRIGRRALTFWGTFSITVILLLCAGLATEGSLGAIKGSVALILVYNFFYNLSIGATAYTILCEVSTTRLRTKTISIGVALQYIIYCVWAFVIPYMFNPDKANLGAKTAFLFGGIGALCLVYLWIYQPETAGRTYEELDELFLKRVKVRDFPTYRTDVQQRMDNEVEISSTKP